MKTHKFKQGIKLKKIHPLIPLHREKEIKQAINDICKDELLKSLHLCDCGYMADKNNICTGCGLLKP